MPPLAKPPGLSTFAARAVCASALSFASRRLLSSAISSSADFSALVIAALLALARPSHLRDSATASLYLASQSTGSAPAGSVLPSALSLLLPEPCGSPAGRAAMAGQVVLRAVRRFGRSVLCA